MLPIEGWQEYQLFGFHGWSARMDRWLSLLAVLGFQSNRLFIEFKEFLLSTPRYSCLFVAFVYQSKFNLDVNTGCISSQESILFLYMYIIPDYVPTWRLKLLLGSYAFLFNGWIRLLVYFVIEFCIDAFDSCLQVVYSIELDSQR